jgi:Mrp family chromosome partitioning ATPase
MASARKISSSIIVYRWCPFLTTATCCRVIGPLCYSSSTHHRHRFDSFSSCDRRSLSSSSSRILQKSTNRTFRFNDNNDNYGSKTALVQLSHLSPRQSAELEDTLLASLNNANNVKQSRRLVDPILGKAITKHGLDWLHSISVPSSTTSSSSSASFLRNNKYDSGDDSNNNNNNDDNYINSIKVSIRLPTLLHPRLTELISNIAAFIQDETVLWIANRRINDTSLRLDWDDSLMGEVRSKGIGIIVNIIPSNSTTNNINNNNDIASSLNNSNNKTRATLQNITHFLAVYSCKGGVGKSTIAVNLAYRLASLGGRVGLVDLDVYGPSLPLLVRPDDPTVRQSPQSEEYGPNTIEPIVHRGVKLMSLGYVSPNSGVPGSGPGGGAAVMRGPMAGRVVSQLLHGTNWGMLDVLVLDLPPGTGDVQLEVCQNLNLSGAVAVSTPSALAWADVHKGVQMFDDMGIRTLAVVENMSYFVCEGGGKHYPFGKSKDDITEGGNKGGSMSSLPGPSRVFRLPISPEVHNSNETGAPLCCDDGGHESSMDTIATADDDDGAAGIFSKLAEAISTDLLLLQHGMTPSTSVVGGGTTTSTVTIDEAGNSIFDVPFTRLSVDNTHKKFTVRLFSDGGGHCRIEHHSSEEGGSLPSKSNEEGKLWLRG